MDMNEQENTALMTECRERTIEVFRAIWDNNYKAAENETGISAAKWKRLCNRAQFPTFEMMVRLAETRTYFLVWMMTGEAATHLQLSPHDKWQHKLARAVGFDMDKRKKAETE